MEKIDYSVYFKTLPFDVAVLYAIEMVKTNHDMWIFQKICEVENRPPLLMHFDGGLIKYKFVWGEYHNLKGMAERGNKATNYRIYCINEMC